MTPDQRRAKLEQSVRACIAYAAGRLFSGRNACSLYDQSQSKQISIAGTVDPHRINVYDYNAGCLFSGTGSNGRFSLYHYGSGHHIILDVEGNRFSGHDQEGDHKFTGTVNSNIITFYDGESGQYFDYSLM